MLRKFRIAFVATLVALAAASAVDTASASSRGFSGRSGYYPGGGFMYGCPCP